MISHSRPTFPWDSLSRRLKRNPSFHIGLLSVLYGVLSVSMVFTNKVILSGSASSNFMTQVILISQCAIATVSVFLCSLFSSEFTLRVSFDDFLLICVVNLSFIGTILANSNTLRYLSIHMVTLLKNTAIVVTAFGDWLFLHHSLSTLCWVAIGLTAIGSSCGVMTDVQFSLIGYAWMALSCGFASGYILLSKRLLSGRNLHFWTLMFWNNLLSAVLLVGFAMVGDRSLVRDWLTRGRLPFEISKRLIWFSGFLGLALNLATYSLLGSTSATSYSVVGVAKKVIQAGLSFVLFKKSATLRNAVSVAIGLMGATLYAYVKWDEQNRADEENRRNDGLKGGGPAAITSV
jgi:drug/metabolite transporter (DMT)-like permease